MGLSDTTEEISALKARGDALFKKSQYGDALQEYKKILKQDPRHKAACFNAGLCLKNLAEGEDSETSESDGGRGKKVFQATPVSSIR